MTDKQNNDQWDISKERAFIEGLVGQRFNFFLIFFSLVLNGFVNAKTHLQLVVVLTAGAIVCSMIAYTLALAQWKLNRILTKLPHQHPFHEISREVYDWSGRDWIGYIIPIACSIALVIGALLSYSNCWLVAGGVD